jgi:hemerythrin-like domain-containing protein
MITRRREFLLAGATLGISGATGRILLAAETPPAAEDVSAAEDLMREHGVLRRLLLIYEEFLRRFRVNGDEGIPSRPLLESMDLIRSFVEDYHEKLEEKFIFPEFEKRNQLVALVKVLREQHMAGRIAVKTFFQLVARRIGTVPHSPMSDAEQREAVRPCEAFIRMYRPHAAREDTVLFPAFKKLLSPKQLDELGDKFEEEENRRFGAKGFEQTVEKVAAIEKELGIYDLSQFTPKLKT